jgi:hypothetical protein
MEGGLRRARILPGPGGNHADDGIAAVLQNRQISFGKQLEQRLPGHIKPVTQKGILEIGDRRPVNPAMQVVNHPASTREPRIILPTQIDPPDKRGLPIDNQKLPVISKLNTPGNENISDHERMNPEVRHVHLRIFREKMGKQSERTAKLVIKHIDLNPIPCPIKKGIENGTSNLIARNDEGLKIYGTPGAPDRGKHLGIGLGSVAKKSEPIPDYRTRFGNKTVEKGPVTRRLMFKIGVDKPLTLFDDPLKIPVNRRISVRTSKLARDPNPHPETLNPINPEKEVEQNAETGNRKHNNEPETGTRGLVGLVQQNVDRGRNLNRQKKRRKIKHIIIFKEE